MKKIIKVFLISFCFISLISLSVSASNSIVLVNGGITDTNKRITATIQTKNFSDGDDITLLVFKPDNKHPEPDATNIVALNQIKYEDNMSSVTFNLPKQSEGIYEIRIGGTNVKTYTSGKFYVTKYSYGDINGDGLYDDKDAILILRVFLELDDINLELNKNYYDLNNDGVINAKDAGLVYKIK